MKKSISLAALSAASLLWAVSASATPTLTLTDGLGNTASGVIDPSGKIVYDGALGFWVINVTTAIASPPRAGAGTLGQPIIHLNSTDEYQGSLSSAGKTLTITFIDDNNGLGLGPSLGSFLNSASSTLPGAKLTIETLINGTAVSSWTSTGPGSFSSDFFSPPENLAAGYTLGIRAIYTATRSGVVNSFDSNISVPDGGMALSLLGVAMVGVEGLRRKFAK